MGSLTELADLASWANNGPSFARRVDVEAEWVGLDPGSALNRLAEELGPSIDGTFVSLVACLQRSAVGNLIAGREHVSTSMEVMRNSAASETVITALRNPGPLWQVTKNFSAVRMAPTDFGSGAWLIRYEVDSSDGLQEEIVWARSAGLPRIGRLWEFPQNEDRMLTRFFSSVLYRRQKTVDVQWIKDIASDLRPGESARWDLDDISHGGHFRATILLDALADLLESIPSGLHAAVVVPRVSSIHEWPVRLDEGLLAMAKCGRLEPTLSSSRHWAKTPPRLYIGNSTLLDTFMDTSTWVVRRRTGTSSFPQLDGAARGRFDFTSWTADGEGAEFGDLEEGSVWWV